MRKLNVALADLQQQQIVLYASKKLPSYAAIFSIILSGNVWLPLSPEIPYTRNLEILDQTDAALLLYEGDSLDDSLSSHCARNNIKTLSMNTLLNSEGEREFELSEFKKDGLAYIMFTSGSTGTPKGVPMTHENYINFVNNALDILPLKEGDVFADFHDFAFDISIFYLFVFPMVRGAISPIMEQKDKVVPINHIVENAVTVWASVPSVINRIKMLRPNDPVETPIRIMFLCGEPLKLDVLTYCFDNMGLQNVYNFYGLTETGVENFYHPCRSEDLGKYEKYGMAPIGTPLPGNSVKITDEKELLIGGCQITPGYLGGRSPEKFENFDGARFCKTGDIVEEYEGVYFCKGRMDSQVKLSGHRVELMDIEAHIAKQDNVDQVVCFVDEGEGRSALVAAIKPEGAVDFKRIQNTLQKELPPYMIPRKHMLLQDFPVNNNGKVDRKKISEKYSSG
jgi:D-alanine--poly(phosphoribitol) ligase subunit 1